MLVQLANSEWIGPGTVCLGWDGRTDGGVLSHGQISVSSFLFHALTGLTRQERGTRLVRGSELYECIWDAIVSGMGCGGF